MIINPYPFQRVYKVFFTAIFLVILFHPSQAVSTPITLDASLGFNGVFSLNTWTPLNVVLENRGKTLEGTLEVVVTSGSEFRGDVHDTTYVMDVELPTRSKKMYAFTIHLDSFIHPLIIRLKEADGTIVTASLNLRSHYTENKLVLFLGIENTPDFSSMPAKGIRPIVSHVRFLPERWFGYDGVESIVLDAMAIAYLRDKQFIALAEWIRRGGQLITPGRLNYGSFLNQRTMRLLPVNVLGFKRLFEINSLEKFCGERLANAEGLLILKVDLAGALTLVQEGDTAIVLQKRLGMGHVVFLAFDLDSAPFSEWSGRQAFWNRILALKTSPYDPGSDLGEQSILKAMISSIPARFPAFGFVLLFLAVYTILVQIVFIRLKKYREQRGKHLSILLMMIALFSLSSYWLFLKKNTHKDPSYNSFLHMKISDQSMTGRAEYIGGLYGLKAGNHRLDFGPSFYPIIPIQQNRPRDTTLHTLSFHENGDEQMLSISLEGWSHRFLKMSTTMTFKVRSKALVDNLGLLLMVENMTPHPILDGRIYYKGRFFSVGDIAPEKKLVKRISNVEIHKRALFLAKNASSVAEEMVGDNASSLLAKIKNNLLEDLLLQIHSRYPMEQEILVLFGWIASNMIPNPLTGPGIDGEGVGLIEWETGIKRHKK